MKTLACSVLLFLCYTVSAQEANAYLPFKINKEKSTNFFSLNNDNLPKLEQSKINLKLPSLYVLGSFQGKDQWVMPGLDFDEICPAGSSGNQGFLGFQTVNSFKLFNSKAVNRFTFDDMGNLRSTEISFGSN